MGARDGCGKRYLTVGHLVAYIHTQREVQQSIWPPSLNHLFALLNGKNSCHTTCTYSVFCRFKDWKISLRYLFSYPWNVTSHSSKLCWYAQAKLLLKHPTTTLCIWKLGALTYTVYWNSLCLWSAVRENALSSYMAVACDDWIARKNCVRDRGQEKGNGERKGRMETGGHLREGGRLRENDDGWKDLKRSKEAKGDRGQGQGSLMKVPCCFLSCSYWYPEQCCIQGQTSGYTNGPSLLS